MMGNKRGFCRLGFVLKFALLLTAVFMLSGCSVVNFFGVEYPPLSNDVAAGYFAVKLKTTTPSEAIGLIILPEYELLSQSSALSPPRAKKKATKAG